MGGREYQVSRIQQDSREKKERKKGKEKEEEEKKKEEGKEEKGGRERAGDMDGPTQKWGEQEEEGRSGSLCSHLLLWDVSLSVTTCY